jgi:hypothetical protein
MYTVAEKVQLLAEEHGISLRGDYASYLANEINRIEGIEADQTLELIGGLMEADILSNEDGVKLILQHHRETSEQAASARMGR